MGMEHLWPDVECLLTTVEVEADGVRGGGGMGGPKLYPGERVHYGWGQSDGLPRFVYARFDPALSAVHIETTRRTVTVPTDGLREAFGLKYVARPLRADEDLISVYGDESERKLPEWWPVELPPGLGAGYLPKGD